MITLLNPWKKRKKKAILILSSALMCTGHSNCTATEGLYAGIGMGSAAMQGKKKSSYRFESKKLRKEGHLGTAFIGYNHPIKDTPLFVGIEGGFQTHALKKKVFGDTPGCASSYDLTVSTNNSVGAHVRVGLTVEHVSFYCKGGTAQTNFKTLYNGVGKKKETTFRKLGASIGIGAEAKLNDNFSFGVDHTYTKHGNLRAIIEDGSIGDRSLRVKPEIHATSLRLIYNF